MPFVLSYSGNSFGFVVLSNQSSGKLRITGFWDKTHDYLVWKHGSFYILVQYILNMMPKVSPHQLCHMMILYFSRSYWWWKTLTPTLLLEDLCFPPFLTKYALKTGKRMSWLCEVRCSTVSFSTIFLGMISFEMEW